MRQVVHLTVPRKTVFLLPTLEGGGAERVVINLLGKLDRNLFSPELVTLYRNDIYRHLVPPDVPLWCLSETRPSRQGSIYQLGRLLKSRQADLLVSFITGANLIALLTKASFRLRIGFIISERNNFSARLNRAAGSWLRSWLRYHYIRFLYSRLADQIITLSDGVRDDLLNVFGLCPDKVTSIHNPIEINTVLQGAVEPLDHPWFQPGSPPVIVSAGRLVPQKGFADLLRAFALVRRSHRCRLMILGSGELRSSLLHLASELGVKDNFCLENFVSNPWAFIARASVFVLSSHWEGFGNVILEAMVCRTPVVATDCDYGPREIITDGRDGLLIPVGSPQAIANAIIRIIDDCKGSEMLCEAAWVRARDFESSKICRKYELVFESVIQRQLYSRSY